MKKLLLALTLLTSLSASAYLESSQLGSSSSENSLSSETSDYYKEQAVAHEVAGDIVVYNLTQEVKPALAQQLDQLSQDKATKGLTLDQAVELIDADVKAVLKK
ncbi:MAG: hypothetical protein HON90_02205 [Halobacteriovoraceae bacterium]|jgi:hypothetical protein|nr:hypothetical protein [Halobacteriovoraceae bacterium]